MPKSKQADVKTVLPEGERDVALIAGQLLSGATAHWGAWDTSVIVKAVSLAREVIAEVERTAIPEPPA